MYTFPKSVPWMSAGLYDLHANRFDFLNGRVFTLCGMREQVSDFGHCDCSCMTFTALLQSILQVKNELIRKAGSIIGLTLWRSRDWKEARACCAKSELLRFPFCFCLLSYFYCLLSYLFNGLSKNVPFKLNGFVLFSQLLIITLLLQPVLYNTISPLATSSGLSHSKQKEATKDVQRNILLMGTFYSWETFQLGYFFNGVLQWKCYDSTV